MNNPSEKPSGVLKLSSVDLENLREKWKEHINLNQNKPVFFNEAYIWSDGKVRRKNIK